MNDELVLDAARALRGDLPSLLGSRPEKQQLAARLDTQLADLLAAATNGLDVTQELLDRMDDLPATHDWALAFLTYGVPPDLAMPIRSPYSGSGAPLGGGAPPGSGEPVRASKFRCPRGDMMWFRRSIGQRVPSCPTHGLLLLAAQSG